MPAGSFPSPLPFHHLAVPPPSHTPPSTPPPQSKPLGEILRSILIPAKPPAPSFPLAPAVGALPSATRLAAPPAAWSEGEKGEKKRELNPPPPSPVPGALRAAGPSGR